MPDQDYADVYSEQPDEQYPGARQRSRPGQAPKEEVYDSTTDAYGNRVTDKPANRAMLASQRRRLEHEARVRALQEKKQRVGRSVEKTTGQSPWSYLALILFLPLLSSFLTQTYSFGLSPYFLPPLRRFWAETPINVFRREMKVFTPDQLARYDGREERPVYLAIDGVVYDVSANRRIYGKGGSYNIMAGRDASRAFCTGCFETHLTHDIRGLSETELASLAHWKSFFADHENYFKVGTVRNPALTPADPIPPPCHVAEPDDQPGSHGQSNNQARGQHAPGETAARHGKPKPGPVHG
ncbi:hypothetical protein IAU60_000113 [Kwoniella sp. DSM 27419]